MESAARPNPPRPLQAKRSLRILISGSSGMIGTELRRQLAEDGHTVLRLVRGRPQGPDEFNWAPAAHMVDFGLFDTIDAVINLSGAPLDRLPWTPRYRKEIRSSRVSATRTLAEAMGRSLRPPEVFISASATGYYGDRPAERLTEETPRGEGFLAEVVDAWEQAAALRPEETRLVTLRTGLVIGREGALKPLIRATRLGLGARIGTGGQHWPWISLHDEAAAIRHLLGSALSGPVNLVGPTPATSDRITAHLARGLRRWYGMTLPEPAVRLTLQGAGTELLLASQKALPDKLLLDGFRFRDRTAEEAIDAEVFARRRVPA